MTNETTPLPVQLKLAASQESLSCQLMEEITAVTKTSKYDHIYISTLVGVLEMIKWNCLTYNAE